MLVGGKRFFPRLAKVGIGANATGVVVFQDRDRGLGELGNQGRRRADIENVVIGKFLALEFFKIRTEVAVEFGLLVRVLTVAESHFEG